MSPVRYALLSLLAREPLTGYDITQYLNTRLAPFWPVRYNQVYPELARMEAEGLVKHHTVESDSYRPTKKVYEITEAGIEALREWVLSPTGPTSQRDEFLLKIYNMWLLEPKQSLRIVNEQRAWHVERAAYYEEHGGELQKQVEMKTQNLHVPLFASVAILDYALGYERHYIAWCDHLISLLSQ